MFSGRYHSRKVKNSGRQRTKSTHLCLQGLKDGSRDRFTIGAAAQPVKSINFFGKYHVTTSLREVLIISTDLIAFHCKSD